MNWSLPSSSILTIPASGGRIETLVRVRPVGLNVAWAPDSRHLAVGSRHGLYVVDLGTGSRKLVAHGNESSADYSPSFSPDSNSLVYRLPRRGGSNIVVTDLKNGRSRLIAQSDVGAGGPVWGSEEIAFTSAGELWLIDGRGKHLRRFRNGAAKVTGVAGPLLWSADGAYIVAARAIVVGKMHLRAVRMPVFDIAKNRLRSVKPPTGWDYQVALSRNGRIVLMGSCRHETTGEGVIAVPLAGGKPRTIVKDACSASWNA